MAHKENRTYAAAFLILAAVPLLVLSCASSPTSNLAATDDAAQVPNAQLNPKGPYIPIALENEAAETAVVLAQENDAIIPAEAVEKAKENGTTSLDVRKVLCEGNSQSK